MTADWVGPMILLNKPNETLLKGFLTEVLKVFTNTTPKNTGHLLRLLCVQDTKSKNNLKNQNWLSRVSIYELSTHCSYDT